MNLSYKDTLLFFMMFFHIVDDFYLQGILAQMKQKSWWEQNYPGKKYQDDYMAALHNHAFSWAFMINLPLIAYCMIVGGKWNAALLTVNWVIHWFIDDFKANKKWINLWQDQLIHLIQIFVTYFIWFFMN